MSCLLVCPSVDWSECSDAQLIDAVLHGQQDAFGELTDRYQHRLVASLRTDPRCASVAEDIAQDAFLRAYRKLHLFRRDSSFYTWLYRIALNSRRYYATRHQRCLALDDAMERQAESWTSRAPSPLEAVEAREECEQVRAALSRLDRHHRDILVLREYEGFDYRAISERLHVTMGTVRSRLSRARAQLKRELNAYWTSPPGANESSQSEGFPSGGKPFSLTA